MKFITQALIFLGAAAIVTADKCSGGDQCECLFTNRSHCCIFSSTAAAARGVVYDCTEVCKGAKRIKQSGESEPMACAADGAFACASPFHAQIRQPCTNV